MLVSPGRSRVMAWTPRERSRLQRAPRCGAWSPRARSTAGGPERRSEPPVSHPDPSVPQKHPIVNRMSRRDSCKSNKDAPRALARVEEAMDDTKLKARVEDLLGRAQSGKGSETIAPEVLQ